MNKFNEIDPERIQTTVKETKIVEKPNKKASASPKLILNDPFKIDEIQNKDTNIKGKWEKVDKASSLQEKPNLLSHSIVSVRGGENYGENQKYKTKRGFNSILEPDAIEKFATNDEQDISKKIKSQNELRKNKKTNYYKEETKDKIIGAFAKKTVFKTEICEPKNTQVGAIDLNLIKDKTDGEKIKESNIKIKEEKSKSNKNWEKVSKESSRKISDDFAESLKKAMDKK